MAIACLACGGDAPQPPTIPVAVVPAPAPVGPLHLDRIGWVDGRSAWAGTTLVAIPQLRLVRIVRGEWLSVSGVPVRFTVRSGAGAIRDTVVTTDGNGFASCGSWTLGDIAGVNTVTATADSVESTSFSVPTSVKPNVVASYELKSNPNLYAVPSVRLVFGDDGSFVAGFDQDLRGWDGYPVSQMYRTWAVFSYSMSGSTIVFGPGYGGFVNSVPETGVIGVAQGDSLILSYSDVDLDPPMPVRQVYVRSTIFEPGNAGLQAVRKTEVRRPTPPK